MELLTHSEFGGCTGRKRAYVVAIHMKQFGISADQARQILSDVWATIATLKVEPQSFEQYLLKDNDPWISDELRRVMQDREKEKEP